MLSKAQMTISPRNPNSTASPKPFLPARLPFLWGAHDRPDNGGLPAAYPFSLVYDTDLEMYRQTGTPELHRLLDEIYERGSLLCGGMDDGAGRFRADAAVDFVLSRCNPRGKRLLEIGSGTGYLLGRLQNTGAIATGLEPGEHATTGSLECSVPVIRDFFPSSRIAGPFDLIVHFNILEHIENPIAFLVEQKKLLAPGGAIFCGLPDCEPYLAAGDTSLFVHEHYNYFTRRSVFCLATQAALRLECIEQGARGGMLFAHMTSRDPSAPPSFPRFSPTVFESRAVEIAERLLAFFAGTNPEDVAVYCPTRALNFLFSIGMTDCRLVDDNAGLHGKYLPSLARPVEGFKDLIAAPPKKLVIFSRTFAAQIATKCRAESALVGVEVRVIADFDSAAPAGFP
jgi:2-polyprenyl-3-methyl-5-hydroxy-6-metoxy-1,4-benzoquinol methylase